MLIERTLFQWRVFAMVELFATYHKSNRLPIDLNHLAIFLHYYYVQLVLLINRTNSVGYLDFQFFMGSIVCTATIKTNMDMVMLETFEWHLKCQTDTFDGVA